MIDRAARDKLALDLRRLVSGVITNDDFRDEGRPSSDPAIQAVEHQAWFLYSDNCNHRLVGQHRLKDDDRRIVARWIVFLDSDLEYMWPAWKHWPIKRLAIYDLFALLFPRWYKKRKEEKPFSSIGDFDVWPFTSKADLETAVKNPRRLAA
jgi:hypothetical protein